MATGYDTRPSENYTTYTATAPVGVIDPQPIYLPHKGSAPLISSVIIISEKDRFHGIRL